jgi:hypothetical protein
MTNDEAERELEANGPTPEWVSLVLQTKMRELEMTEDEFSAFMKKQLDYVLLMLGIR